MRKFFHAFFFAFLLVAGELQPAGRTNAQVPKGKLFIIGGGQLDDSLRIRMLAEAWWKKANPIIAVTLASSGGDSAYYWITTKRSTFPVLRAGNLELSTGLAFLDSVIIDQHFLVSSRFNRLLSAKIEHPAYDCIGIDESTALIVNGSSATVAGRNQVVVIGLPKDIHVSPSGRLDARNMPVSIYIAGEKFNIKR